MSRHRPHKRIPQGTTKTLRVLANKSRAVKRRCSDCGKVVTKHGHRNGVCKPRR